MLRIDNITKSFENELGEVKNVFNGLNLNIEQGDFISIIGSNGAGKSTLLDTITGNITPDSGKINIDGKDITDMPKHKRGSFISKVYQNPSVGTAPSMTVFENLSMADNKGKTFGFSLGLNKKRKEYYRSLLKELGLGIENQMDTEVKSLSGGQRQCLALIMATLNKPKVLLLDEHTAALDPKTADLIMELTEKIVREKQLTAIMVTHNLRYAVEYGDRLLMMHQGNAVMDAAAEKKKEIKIEDILEKFNEISIECGN